MKVYLAIGHFKDSMNVTSVAMKVTSRASFEQNLKGNEFIAYAVISKKKFAKLISLLDESMDFWNEVIKLTTNYRVWNILCDYIGQCYDIMQERFDAAI